MSRRLVPDTMPTPASNYAHVHEVEMGARTIFMSGQVGLDRDGNTADDFEAQCVQAFANVGAGLAAAGMSWDDVARINSYLTDVADIGTFRDVRDRVVTAAPGPASTLVIVAALAAPNWKVEIEVVAAKS